MKTGCPAEIQLKAIKGKLVVTKINLDHRHDPLFNPKDYLDRNCGE